jgi:hypothetical protein
VPEVFQFARLITFCSQHSISEKVNAPLAHLIHLWLVINFITMLLFGNTKVFYNIIIYVFIGAKGLVNINVKKCSQKATQTPPQFNKISDSVQLIYS